MTCCWDCVPQSRVLAAGWHPSPRRLNKHAQALSQTHWVIPMSTKAGYTFASKAAVRAEKYHIGKEPWTSVWETVTVFQSLESWVITAVLPHWLENPPGNGCPRCASCRERAHTCVWPFLAPLNTDPCSLYGQVSVLEVLFLYSQVMDIFPGASSGQHRCGASDKCSEIKLSCTFRK